MIYLVLSALLYVINNFYWKHNLNLQINEFTLIFNRAIYTVLISLILNIVIPTGIFELTLINHLSVCIASFLGALGLIFMVRGLKLNQLNQLGIYNLFGALISLLIVEFYITSYHILAYPLIFLTLYGYVLCIYPIRGHTFSKLNLNFLGMVICFTASSFIHWMNLKNIHPIYVCLNQEVIVLTSSLVWIKLFNKSPKIIVKSIFHQIHIILSAFIILGALCIGYFALQKVDPFMVNLVYLTIGPITFLIGIIVFRESIKFRKVIGILAMTMGISILYMIQN